MVQEWLASRLKGHLESVEERPDGAIVIHLVGKFRADFRLSMMMTTVRRVAAMQLGTVCGDYCQSQHCSVARSEVGPEELELCPTGHVRPDILCNVSGPWTPIFCREGAF